MPDILRECYTDYRVITEMPKGIFADRFGCDMQKSISRRNWENKFSWEYFDICPGFSLQCFVYYYIRRKNLLPAPYDGAGSIRNRKRG